MQAYNRQLHRRPRDPKQKFLIHHVWDSQCSQTRPGNQTAFPLFLPGANPGGRRPRKRPAAVGVLASVLAIVVLRIKVKNPYVLCE